VVSSCPHTLTYLIDQDAGESSEKIEHCSELE
jgi:hypothetical protein